MVGVALVGAFGGALLGAVVSQLLAAWFAGRRDDDVSVQRAIEALGVRIEGRLDRVDNRLDSVEGHVANTRERLAGVEGVLRLSFPPTPLEEEHRRARIRRG